MTSSQENDYSIFLSHRGHDSAIAEAFAANFVNWGFSRQKNIFQFTDTRSGVAPGKNISSEILEAIRHNDLFISIYTNSTFDWSYCMYERGAADAIRSRPSQVVTVHFTDARPPIMQDQLAIDGRKLEDIEKFVRIFHTDIEWAIPHTETRDRLKSVFQFINGAEDDAIKTRAKALFEDINNARPVSAESRARHRLEFLQFTLDYTNLKEVRAFRRSARELIEEARNNGADLDAARAKSSELRQKALETLREALFVTEETEDAALGHFGVGSIDSTTNFSSLYRRWEQELDDNEIEFTEEDRQWRFLLLEDFSRSTEFSPSRALNYGLLSPRLNDGSLLKPIIVRCTEETDGSMTFDCYLVKVPNDQSS